MSGGDSRQPNLSRIVSVPGIVALAVLGAFIVGVSSLLGTEVVLREILVELVASFGSALLVIAIFGLLFRSGIERLIRRAPGGDLYAQSTEHLRELLEEVNLAGGSGDSRVEERLDRIEESISSLSDRDIPSLKQEIQTLRKLLEEAQSGEKT